MNEIIRYSATELAAKLRAGEITSVQAVQAHLDRIAEVDGGERGIHAFLHVNGEEALAVAAEVDAIRAAGGAEAKRCTRSPVCRSPSRTSSSPRASPPPLHRRCSKAG